MDTTTNTNKGQIYIIICTIVFLTACCVATNCYLAIHEKEPPQAFTLLTGGLVGSLTAMLVKTSPTESSKAPPQQPPPASPPPSNGAPTEVTVVNPPSDPVHTEENKT